MEIESEEYDMKFRDPETREFKELYTKAADTLPVGTEVDYEGEEVPAGWEEVEATEVILFENTDGINGDITLNDNATNYKYLEIFFGNNTITSAKFLVDIDRSILLHHIYIENLTYCYTYYEELTINNKQLVKQASYRVDNSTNGFYMYDSNQLKVFKVIGYK